MVNIEVLRGPELPDGGFTDETLRVFTLLRDETVWGAGRHKNQPVNIRFIVPMKICLK